MLVAVACGTDNGNTPLPGSSGGNDASANNDTGSSSGGNDSGGNGDSGDGGSNADCGRAPTLRGPDAAGAGPFCLGVQVDAGVTKSINCGTDESCCAYTTSPDGGSVPDSGFPASFCQGARTCTFPTVPAGLTGIPFECTHKTHCPSAAAECCLILKPGKNFSPTPDTPSCPDNLKQSNVFGTACRATCAGGETRLCFADSDCPGGAQCKPFSMSGRDVGYCK
jgi:hypothetical protein